MENLNKKNSAVAIGSFLGSLIGLGIAYKAKDFFKSPEETYFQKAKQEIMKKNFLFGSLAGGLLGAATLLLVNPEKKNRNFVKLRSKALNNLQELLNNGTQLTKKKNKPKKASTSTQQKKKSNTKKKAAKKR